MKLCRKLNRLKLRMKSDPDKLRIDSILLESAMRTLSGGLRYLITWSKLVNCLSKNNPIKFVLFFPRRNSNSYVVPADVKFVGKIWELGR